MKVGLPLGLMKSSRTRNKLHKKSIGHDKSHIYYTKYIQYRKAHNKLKRYARYSYYRDLLEQHRSDIRKNMEYHELCNWPNTK